MTDTLRRVALLALAGALAGACGGERPAPAPASTPASDSDPGFQVTAPVGSDSLARAVLIDVTELDPSIQVYPSYATDHNFTGAVLPGYDARRILLRREVAVALARAQAALRPEHLGIRVFDGYRPVRATRAMVAWADSTGRSDLLDDGYIARHSRHNLGVAVDLTLIDLESGHPLEMGTAFDTFDPSAHTMNATGAVLQNRLKLKQALEAEGFTNYDQEWWHYSYPVTGAVPFDLPITR